MLDALLRDLPALTDPAARADWIVRLGSWLHQDPSRRLERARALLAALDADAPARAAVAALWHQVVFDTNGLRLFADTGLPSEFGFVSEAVNRLAALVLPSPPDPRNLAEVLEAMAPTAADAEWVAEMPSEVFASIRSVFAAHPDARVDAEIREDFLDAITVLAANVASLGVSKDVLDRLPEGPVQALPFLALTQDCEAFARVIRGQRDEPSVVDDVAQRMFETVRRCRARVGQVVAHVETHGVSLHLVYRLEKLSTLLDRLELIVVVLATPDDQVDGPLQALVAALVRGLHTDRSIGALIRGNLRQLSRKVVERTGDAGRHYLVSSREQWWQMFRGAAGGGVLTVLTTVLKFAIAWLKLPMLFEGLALAFNYAGCFVTMQLVGFKLATKQPAMFAASMAGSFLERQDQPGRDADGFTEEVARVTRSQTAAVAGNIGFVIPAALAFDAAWRLMRGHSFLDSETAAYAVTSLDPLASLTIAFAAMTGVILMVSSIAGGWLENFIVYRRLPAAVAEHRGLRRWIGADRAGAWAAAMTHGAAGMGTSVALGFLLGMLPAVGKFAGVPLEVRHVTLSAGQLALGVAALGADATLNHATLMALAGVAVIGLMNFGVSFLLALYLAVRARDVRWPYAWRLVGKAGRVFLRRPWLFLMPPPREVENRRAVLEDEALAERMSVRKRR